MSKKKKKKAIPIIKAEPTKSPITLKLSKVVKKYNDPNVEVNLKVKILKAGAYEWYHPHIGESFRVQLEGYAHYWIVTTTKEKVKGKLQEVTRMKPILMDDCVVLKKKVA